MIILFSRVLEAPGSPLSRSKDLVTAYYNKVLSHYIYICLFTWLNNLYVFPSKYITLVHFFLILSNMFFMLNVFFFNYLNKHLSLLRLFVIVPKNIIVFLCMFPYFFKVEGSQILSIHTIPKTKVAHLSYQVYPYH